MLDLVESEIARLERVTKVSVDRNLVIRKFIHLYPERKVELESMLSDMLSEDELVSVIMEEGITSIAEAHKFLKTHYKGCYTGKSVANAIRRCV